MKWKLNIVCAVFLLSGCSFIKVDKVSEQQSEHITKEQDTTEQTIEDLNIFDWSERKLLEAENVYYLALGDSLTRGIGDETDR